MLHGLLHLAGYDHEIDSGQMARREQKLRAKLRLPHGLIERTTSPAPKLRVGRATKVGCPILAAVSSRKGWEGTNPTGRAPMSWLTISLLVFAALVDTFAAYISRVYSEFGKILPREVQDNLDEWEEKVEPLLGLTREHAALCATVLQQLTLGRVRARHRRGAFRSRPACGAPHLS